MTNCTKSKFCAKGSRRKYILFQNSLYLAICRGRCPHRPVFIHILINVTLLLFYLNRLKTILTRLNFNLIYNIYTNLNFTKFLITIYIIIYKIFSKISQILIYQYLAKITDNKLYTSFFKMA